MASISRCALAISLMLIQEAWGSWWFQSAHLRTSPATESSHTTSTTNQPVCLVIPTSYHGRWYTTKDRGGQMNIGDRMLSEKSRTGVTSGITASSTNSISQLACYNDSVIFKNIAINPFRAQRDHGFTPMRSYVKTLKNKCVMIQHQVHDRQQDGGRRNDEMLSLKITNREQPLCNKNIFDNPRAVREYLMSRSPIPDIIITSMTCDLLNNTSTYLKSNHLQLQASSGRNCALLCHMQGINRSFMLSNYTCYCISSENTNNSTQGNNQHQHNLLSCYPMNRNNKIVIYRSQTRITFRKNTKRRINEATRLINNVAASILSPLMHIQGRFGFNRKGRGKIVRRTTRNGSVMGNNTKDSVTFNNNTSINNATLNNATLNNSTLNNSTLNNSILNNQPMNKTLNNTNQNNPLNSTMNNTMHSTKNNPLNSTMNNTMHSTKNNPLNSTMNSTMHSNGTDVDQVVSALQMKQNKMVMFMIPFGIRKLNQTKNQ